MLTNSLFKRIFKSFSLSDKELSEAVNSYELIKNSVVRKIHLQSMLNEDPVDIVIGESFGKSMESIAKGEVFMRTHYSDEHVKCVHNRYTKNSYIKPCRFPDYKQSIYITNGSLKIVILGENNVVLSENILKYDDKIQPHVIEVNTPHYIEAIEEPTDFVIRFDLIK